MVNFVDVKLVDKTTMHLLPSIGIFYLFIETISNEKECENGISKPILHFQNPTKK